MLAFPLLAWFTDPWTFGLVAIVALLLFGKRLPEVGRSLGKGIAEFKKGLKDVAEEVNRDDPPPTDANHRLRPPADAYQRELPPEPRRDAAGPPQNAGAPEAPRTEQH